MTEFAAPLIVQPPAATMTTLRSPACVAEESVGRRVFCVLPDLEITDDQCSEQHLAETGESS